MFLVLGRNGVGFRQCFQLPYQVSLIISKCLLLIPPAPPAISCAMALSGPQELNSWWVWGEHFRVTDTTTVMGTNSSSLFIDTVSFEVCFCSQHGKISRSLLALAAVSSSTALLPTYSPIHGFSPTFFPLPQHLNLPPGPGHSFKPSFLNFFVLFPSLPVYLLPSWRFVLYCWGNSPPQLSLPAPTVTSNCLGRFWCCPRHRAAPTGAASGT